MKKIIAALLILLAYSPAFAQNTGNLLSSYMNVKNALVSSNSKAAATAINSFYEAVKSENDFTEKAELLKATGKLSKAGSDLERQRAAFNEVSVVMWKLVKATGKVEQPVYYQYCPMKKGYWLSTESDIKNPYYGASMLSCGSVKETKK